MGFDQFLSSYLFLWIPDRARDGVEDAVMSDGSINGRQRNAVFYLQRLRASWNKAINTARNHKRCGICDGGVPRLPSIRNLYEAKIWSQLFYDSCVPFDTCSKREIVRAGYTSPLCDYSAMNRELFADLRTLAEKHSLTVLGIRQLDAPARVVLGLTALPHGQPLSRVIDKVFYAPKPVTAS